MTTNIKIIITTKTRNIITCIVRCKMIIKITAIYIGKITIIKYTYFIVNTLYNKPINGILK